MDSVTLQNALRKLECISYDKFREVFSTHIDSYVDELWLKKKSNLAVFIMNLDEATLDRMIRKVGI